MRKIPVKNYIIFIVLVGVTIFLTFYCCELYKSQHGKQYSPLMLSLITEIKEDDIDNYVLENPTVVLYVSDKKEESFEKMEKSLKKLLTEKNIYSYFAYIDISLNRETALNRFQEKYKVTLDYRQLPTLIAFQDGEITEVYNIEEWNKREMIEFLTRNEVIESD